MNLDDLLCEFSGGRQYERLTIRVGCLQLLKDADRKGGRLASTCVWTSKGWSKTVLTHRSRGLLT